MALLENRAFLVIWVILGKTGHLGYFGLPFLRRDRPLDRKFHLKSGLNQQNEAKSAVFVHVNRHQGENPPRRQGGVWWTARLVLVVKAQGGGGAL